MNSDQHEAQIAAERDAEADVSKIVWLVVGFALNVIGILIAYIYEPSPPISRIHNQSQEYTLFYRDAYRAKVRHIQLVHAAIGFAIEIGIALIGVLFFMSIVGSIMGGMP